MSPTKIHLPQVENKYSKVVKIHLLPTAKNIQRWSKHPDGRRLKKSYVIDLLMCKEGGHRSGLTKRLRTSFFVLLALPALNLLPTGSSGIRLSCLKTSTNSRQVVSLSAFVGAGPLRPACWSAFVRAAPQSQILARN